MVSGPSFRVQPPPPTFPSPSGGDWPILFVQVPYSVTGQQCRAVEAALGKVVEHFRIWRGERVDVWWGFSDGVQVVLDPIATYTGEPNGHEIIVWISAIMIGHAWMELFA